MDGPLQDRCKEYTILRLPTLTILSVKLEKNLHLGASKKSLPAHLSAAQKMRGAESKSFFIFIRFECQFCMPMRELAHTRVVSGGAVS